LNFLINNNKYISVMTKNLTLVALSLMFGFLTLASSACMFMDGVDGNGNVIKETRDVSSFDAIKIGGAFEVYLSQGSSEGLVIEADENLMELIRVEVRGGTLVIDTEVNIRKSKEMNLYITFTDLEKMKLSGAVEVKSEEKLKFDNLELDGSGASEIDLHLEANRLECDFSGASEIELKGKANYCSIDNSGASELNAYDFIVGEYNIEISGAGDAKIHCTDILKARISGAASIRYQGDPKVDSHVSGAGSIKQR
jgi:hypothetical protein